MSTPSTMIINALIMTGEKVIGDTLSAAEQTHYLAKLNAMLESWSLERLMCYQIVQESLALTSSVGSYTIGSGGAFNTTRPTRIVDPCFIRNSSSIDYPVELIDAQAYGLITSKTVDNAIPGYLFYDSAFASSLATIFLYPEPAASLTLYINSWKQLQTFALISTTVTLPPGYQRAIESNFAIESAGGFVNVQPEVIKVAKESKAAIKAVNAPEGILRMDPGVLGRRNGRWDIRTG